MPGKLSRSLVFSVAVALTAASATAAVRAKKHKSAAPKETPLEQYVRDAETREPEATQPLSPGSLFSPAARLAGLGLDFRASRVDDIVTILVQERASAVTSGATQTARASKAAASVSALGGPIKATSPLAKMADLSGSSSLDGKGATSRQTTLSTAMTARVLRVLANGNLVIEGAKTVQINSENQVITVRGVVRPADIATNNTVASDQIAELEVRVNGKGVVGDAVRRPFILYRLLLGILPF